MGKKGGKTNKGRAVIVSSGAELGTFSEQAIKEQQEAEFEDKQDCFKPLDPLSKIKQNKLKAEQSADISIKESLTESEKVQGTNESEIAFWKLYKAVEKQTDAKYEHNHYEMIQFASLDNNLVDSVFSNLMTLSEDQHHDSGLAEAELIFHLRKITKELEYLLDFPFVKFWVYIAKFPVFIEFLDNFLMNVRKYNDLEKITIDLNTSFNDSKLSSSGPDIQEQIKY